MSSFSSTEITTGITDSIGAICTGYSDGADTNSAVYEEFVGLDIDEDVATAFGTLQPAKTAHWDRYHTASSGDYAAMAVKDFLLGTTTHVLEAQRGLALTFVTEIKALTGVSVSIEQAVVEYFDGLPVKAYIEKATGLVTYAETVQSETTHIPIGKYLAGVGHAVAAFAIYETFKQAATSAYNATLGNEDTFTPLKDYLIASAMIVAGGAGAVAFGPGTIGIVGGAIVGGLAGKLADELIATLPGLIYGAKVGLESLEDTLGLVYDDVVNGINGLWDEVGPAADDALDDVADLLDDLLDGIKDTLPELDLPTGAELPAFFDGLRDLYFDAPRASDPIVLDLDNDGIELTTFDAGSTTTFFDIDGDGFAEQTAWVDADDGLLARDINENGTIDDVTELFGSPGVDGFALLLQLDSNGDLAIDQYDDAWDELVVWQDINGDAVSQADELHTMADLDIVSFNLSTLAASTSVISGNRISHSATYTLDGGGTRTIADAWLVLDQANTYSTSEYSIDLNVLTLPALRGYGELPDLHIAMSADEELLDLVAAFVGGFDLSIFEDATALNDAVADILYLWAGVDEVSPSSLGPYVDARHVRFLEKFFGEPFHLFGWLASPNVMAAGILEAAWDAVLDTMKTHLLVQAGAQVLFDEGTVAYNAWSGEIEGDMDLSETAIEDLALAADAATDTLAFWHEFAVFVAHTKGLENVTGTEEDWLDVAVQDSTGNGAMTWDYAAAGAGPPVTGNTHNGTSGNDVLSGGAGNDTINGYEGNDTLTGNAGDDFIAGFEGEDTLYGGNGEDLLQGGADDDEIHGGDNDDNIDGGAGADLIHGDGFGEHGDDLIHGGDGNDVIHGGAGDDDIDGELGDDTIYGGDGNDTIVGEDGNDTLYGEAGGNTVVGGDGNDIYVYGGGDDLYSEYGTTGTDTILLPDGVVLGDLTFVRLAWQGVSDHLLITIDGMGTIETPLFWGYYGTIQSDRIETITFHDTSTFALDSFTAMTAYGTAGNDYILYSYPGAHIENTMFGLDGNDELIGGSEDDVLDGGMGNDTLTGYGGDDVYVASPGFDSISDSGGTDTILMPEGIDEGDLTFLRLAGEPSALTILINGLGQIKLSAQIDYGTDYVIETITFANSTTLALADVVAEYRGGSGNDNVSYASFGVHAQSIFDGRDGNDGLNGGTEDDVFFFSAGEDDVVTGTGFDIVRFRDGWAPESVEIFRRGTSLYLVDFDDNEMEVAYHFYASGEYGIDEIVFANSTVWEPALMEIETRGTSGNDSLGGADVGDASSDDVMFGFEGNDNLNGGNGNDVLHGGDDDDWLEGAAGDDVLVYSAGIDTVSDTGDGADTLLMTGGVTVSDISFSDVSSWDTKITVNASVDEVTVLYTRGGYAPYYIERIAFDDGFETGLIGYASWMTGTSGNDLAAGNSSDNTILGLAGHDDMDGGAGNDDIHGGSGNDEIWGGDGDDLLHGGTDNDVLYGEDGLDRLFGGAGADTFVFEDGTAFNDVDTVEDFNPSVDKLDIADILDGFYTHGVDSILDFVQIVDDGANSLLKVDQNGGGNSFVTIATILGINGLTDEAALQSGGTLITH